MQKKNFLPILALAVGHLVTDLQAGALPIVLPHLKELFTLSPFPGEGDFWRANEPAGFHSWLL